MRDRRGRPQYRAQIRTFNSQESCIDIYSKVESLFLQKYFRYNLTDYFQDTLSNIEEGLLQKKLKNKFIKQLVSQTYLSKGTIRVDELTQQINDFYTSRSKIIEEGEFKHCFKHLYSSRPSDIKDKELVIVEVKIRAEIQKIQVIPQVFFRELNQHILQNSHLESEEPQLFAKLRSYSKGVINFFLVYYGDINFNIFRQKNFNLSTIRLFNREIELRTYVFYVSRLSMIASFKKMNKIQNLQYINDILIQLHEIKRDKARTKKRNKEKEKSEKLIKMESQAKVKWMKWAAIFVVGGMAAGIVIQYYF